MGYIYKVQNIVNDKVYIGKTTKTPQKRFEEHLDGARKHINVYLYDAMNHYGYSNFLVSTIEECSDKELNNRERYWIDYYRSNQREFGYNMTAGGDGGDVFSLLPEDRKAALRENISKKLKGRKQPPELVARRVAAIKGQKRTAEQRARMSEAQKKRDPSTFKGPEMTPERKQRLREVNLGKKQSEETKQKRKESLSKLKWYNNGTESIRSETCPEGYVEGRLSYMTQESKDKCSQRGKHWYTNGIVNTMAYDCPEGFWLGKIYRTRGSK